MRECNPNPECYTRYPKECQDQISRCMTATWISEFDANFVIQLYGYKTTTDYY